MLQQQGLMVGSPQEEPPPQGWLLPGPRAQPPPRAAAPGRLYPCPALSLPRGGSSCVTVGGHFPALSGLQQH